MYNQKIKNLYGLHICKTGGRFYHSSVLIPTIQSSKINIPMIEDGSDDHYGWHKDILNNTFIIAGIRDIIKQKCSLFIDIMLNAKLNNEEYNFEKKDFLKWISESYHAQNNMSKHFFYSEKIINYGMNLEPRPMRDLNLILQRADRVNLYYDIDENFNTYDLSKKLSDRLNIPFIYHEYANRLNVGKNLGSKILYDSLDKYEKEFINSVSFLDLKLYEFIKNTGK